MAIPTQQGAPQGGLNQASQATPPTQAGANLDVDAKQFENLETETKSSGLKNKIVDDLGDQREAMNSALLRMRESLDARKNQLFDPVLMQTAAGFLKPTKTGSFGESLGYAAEGASVAAERQMLRDAENQKLEMELMGKEQEFRQQLGGDQLMSALLGGPRTGGSGAPAPAGGAVVGADGKLRVPGTTSPVDLATLKTPEQVVTAARQGRIPVTDEILALASRVAPKLLPFLQEMRKSQTEEEKNQIEREKFEGTTRKVKPLGGLTEREMDRAEYKEYQAKVDEANNANDEQILLRYYRKKGWLEGNQLGNFKPAKEGEPPSPIPRSKTQPELDAEQAQMVETQKIRAKSSEDAGNMVLDRGRNANNMEALATDVLSLTDSNAKAFNLMQNATVRDALLTAIEQGADIGVGSMKVSINLPVRIALRGNKEYALTKDDIAALQLFQQKQSAITAEMRKMARSPGEGATDKTEGQLYAAIGVLPSDSAKVLALKSEAMIQRARYDDRHAQLWSQFQEDNPNKSYTYFQHNDKDYKELQKNYVRSLNDMREKNADMLRTSPKKAPAPANAPASAPAASAPANKPAVTPAPVPSASAPANAPSTSGTAESSKAPANELPHEKFKREKAERERKAQGNQ